MAGTHVALNPTISIMLRTSDSVLPGTCSEMMVCFRCSHSSAVILDLPFSESGRRLRTEPASDKNPGGTKWSSIEVIGDELTLSGQAAGDHDGGVSAKGMELEEALVVVLGQSHDDDALESRSDGGNEGALPVEHSDQEAWWRKGKGECRAGLAEASNSSGCAAKSWCRPSSSHSNWENLEAGS